MAIFAPAYLPPQAQQTLLTRRQKVESRKRKRGDDSSDDHESHTPTEDPARSPSPTPRTASSFFHPVNSKDPYYVAGHPREKPLPPAPFPHAGVKPPEPLNLSIAEELASLNPPVYINSASREDKSTSLKRRHIDNLTTILHRCMLNDDWKRASRAWAVLIRTEVAGRGTDIRRNGLWGIGAELLMRRQRDSTDDNDKASPFSDAGFKLARQYYERLILQYPHTPRSQHHLNALVIYPALFNVWIYEVQDRSKPAIVQPKVKAEGDSDSAHSDDMLSSSPSSDRRDRLQSSKAEELASALPIAEKLDDLLLSPPYDTSNSLLRIRGMVALWISDLHLAIATTSAVSEHLDEDSMADDSVDPSCLKLERGGAEEQEHHRQRAEAERLRARQLFRKVADRGGDIPEGVNLGPVLDRQTSPASDMSHE